MDSELGLIALAIEDLQGRLNEANARLGGKEYMEATEFEIGRLLVEAQRFSDSALTYLEVKVHEVLAELATKARQILAEATEEAHEIRQHAQQAALASTQTARDLQAVIAGFTSVNADLLKELGGLNDVLVSATQADLARGVDGAPSLAPNHSALGFDDAGG